MFHLKQLVLQKAALTRKQWLACHSLTKANIMQKSGAVKRGFCPRKEPHCCASSSLATDVRTSADVAAETNN